MFEEDSRFGDPVVDESGAVFLDRETDVFKWILDGLRRGGHMVGVVNPALLPLLRNEADFFSLHTMVADIDTLLAAEDERQSRLPEAFELLANRIYEPGSGSDLASVTPPPGQFLGNRRRSVGCVASPSQDVADGSRMGRRPSRARRRVSRMGRADGSPRGRRC